MSICPICAELSLRLVICPHCNSEFCSQCFRKYLLTTTTEIPLCMCCNKIHTLEFIRMNTTKTFHDGQYRNHRAVLLLQKEKLILPDKMQLAHEQKNILNIRDIIDNRKKQKKELLDMKKEILSKSETKKEILENRVLLKKIANLIQEVNAGISSLVETITELDIAKRRRYYDSQTICSSEKEYILCPYDSCRGSINILESDKCPICSQQVCKKCYTKISENHKCSDNDIKSLKYIKKSTKNCPKCTIPIYKIDGCEQIWCVKCHTAFNYVTGKIETKIHNPHYYEWMRSKNNRIPRVEEIEELDLACDINLEKIYSLNCSIDHFDNILVLVTQITEVFIPIYTENHEYILDEYRVQFILSIIDEDEWLKLLKQEMKKMEKNSELTMLLRMLRNCLNDLLVSYQNKVISEEILNINLSNLKEYFNSQITELSKIYTGILILSDDWRLVKYKK